MIPGTTLPDGRRLVSVPTELKDFDFIDAQYVVPVKDMDILVLGQRPSFAQPSNVVLTSVPSGRLNGVEKAARVPSWIIQAKTGVPIRLPKGSWAVARPGEASGFSYEKSLCDLANKYGTDKGPRHHGFTSFYSKSWDFERHSISTLLEIGVDRGSSQRMFQEYFPNAVIYGVDINEKCLFNEGKIVTFKANQADEKSFLDAILLKTGGDFDVIIDDGSHNVIHQQITFGFLFPKVKPGGWYVIEDLHTSNFGGWGLPKGHPDATLPLLKRLASKQPMDSKYMTRSQEEFISSNVLSCEIFENGSNHITSMIRRQIRRQM